MENKLEIFKNEEFGEVRMVEENGKMMFCGSDVAKALGYNDTNQAIRKNCKKDGVSTRRVIDNLGREQQAKFINEGNLYRLITHSKLPSAEKFESWVFDEVLPSIRKQGKYEIPKSPMEALQLMFDAQKQTEQKIDKLDNRVIEIEENLPLNPGEYALIGNKVSEKIRNVKRELGLINCTQKQNRELFASINREIKVIAGVKTRSQLRQRHLDDVLDFIRDWEPSKATRVILEQLGESNA